MVPRESSPVIHLELEEEKQSIEENPDIQTWRKLVLDYNFKTKPGKSNFRSNLRWLTYRERKMLFSRIDNKIQ